MPTEINNSSNNICNISTKKNVNSNQCYHKILLTVIVHSAREVNCKKKKKSHLQENLSALKKFKIKKIKKKDH